MADIAESIERHYGRGHILDSIVAALRAEAKDPARLVPTDLASVDEFHVRGREATLELAQRAHVRAGQRVLDVGCGLGGSARHLAAEHGCDVTGVDLTAEYVSAARELTRLVRLDDRVRFELASALALPFGDATFDIAWTEHAQMNIADKRTLYAEIARVLVPGGRLVFHDIFQGGGGPPHFPVPWAEDVSTSFLATPAEVRSILETLGFRIVDWADRTTTAQTWLEGRLAQPAPVLGIHLLMGANARTKLENIVRNLAEGRIAVLQAVVQKGGEAAR
jgi:ubiquinone/menaquinone biosynthesis C-methylase UbiE